MSRILISLLLILSLSSCGGNAQLYLRKTVEGVHTVAKFANGNVDLGVVAKNERQAKAINGIYKTGIAVAKYMAPGYASTCVYVVEKGTGLILKCMDRNKLEPRYFKSISGHRLSDYEAEKQAERITKRKIKKGFAKLYGKGNFEPRDEVVINFKIQIPDDLDEDDLNPGFLNPNLNFEEGTSDDSPPPLQFR